MSLFAMAYRLSRYSAAAYGPHHVIANIDFQSLAQESLLSFCCNDNSRLSQIIALVHEHHNYNIEPVKAGDKVAILLSCKQPTDRSICLCFRVINEKGKPISYGYRTLFFVDSKSFQPISLPKFITQYINKNSQFCLLEEGEVLFKDRGLVDDESINQIFYEDVIKAGKYVTSNPRYFSSPDIIDLDQQDDIRGVSKNNVVTEEKKSAFVFPGQGAYDHEVLKTLYFNLEGERGLFEQVDRLSKKYFNESFLDILLSGVDPYAQNDMSFPDVDQIGIYLCNYLIGKQWIDKGENPDILIGHSFGEYAALAMAGVVTAEQGAEIVCQRLKALHSIHVQGRMAAISTNAEIIKKYLEHPDWHRLELSVINHDKLCVISGFELDIVRLRDLLLQRGVSTTLLKSRYPFHSSHLSDAVAVFKRDLEKHSYKSPKVPVYLGTENKMLDSLRELPTALASQFTRPLDFSNVVTVLDNFGVSKVFEAGVGTIVTGILKKSLKNEQVHFQAPVKDVESLKSWLGKQEDSVPALSKSNITSSFKDTEEAIAIISSGCYLPGAKDVDSYWDNILKGKSSLIDIAKEDIGAAKDFLCEQVDDGVTIKPDKSYTLLNGSILNVNYDAAILGQYYSQKEYNKLTKGQKLLAHTVAQVFKGFNNKYKNIERSLCVLGSTADGCVEYDAALFADSLYEIAETIGFSQDSLKRFDTAIRQINGYGYGDEQKLVQSSIYHNVLNKMFSQSIDTTIVDSACSSSLYSIYFAIEALRNNEKDIVFAGGVFAPGPANNALFAQFNGLATKESRPFDSKADGVIFGDGAALLAMKRLSDAIKDGDNIQAVIRGVGLSSDGKSPSIIIPQKKGQCLAIKRAYERANIPLDSIQYIEAHATSTTIGDAVEFDSLNSSFTDIDSKKISIGSVKSLIGHTGWVSGVASIIKVIKAIQHKTIPKQYFFDKASSEIPLDSSPFNIPLENEFWPENYNHNPRRAGINGFGFGGTNAHLVLEEYIPEYHKVYSKKTSGSFKPVENLAVLGWSVLYPSEDTFVSKNKSNHYFRYNRSNSHLPKKKLLLPDVQDHMDVSQFLSALAAENIFDHWQGWEAIKRDIGIVLGLHSKTESGRNANERIFLDRCARLLNEDNSIDENDRIELIKQFEHIRREIEKKNPPSGPYTLPGLMPNVTASRIACLFDLQGPNLVVDQAENSLRQAFLASEKLLREGQSKVILTGGVNAASSYKAEHEGEAIVLLAVCTEQEARMNGWETQGIIPADVITNLPEFSSKHKDRNYKGAHGFEEFLDHLGLVPVERPEGIESTSKKISAVELHSKEEDTKKMTAIQEAAVAFYHPIEVEIEGGQAPVSLRSKKLLVVTDQKNHWNNIKKNKYLSQYDFTILAPKASNIEGAIEVDLNNDESAAHTLDTIKESKFDYIIGLKSLQDLDTNVFLNKDLESQSQFVELLFLVCKSFYSSLRANKLQLVSICFSAFYNNRLHPYSGLVAGFMKSIAREFHANHVRILNTDCQGLVAVFEELEKEIAEPAYLGEINYRQGVRHAIQLKLQEKFKLAEKPKLTKDSVVLVTGGGRGVTAALVEKLLKTYGCTVIATGRTALEEAPDNIRSMTEQEFREYESEFYKMEMKKNVKGGITELKRLYQKYQAVNELQHVIDIMNKLPGKFIYHTADLNDERCVATLMKKIQSEQGQLDMLMHGAGIQHSSALYKKTLDKFRLVLNTKLGSLGYLYRSARKYFPNSKIDYHLLTSAFSYMGNDGQSDYGAANEAMNRIVECMAVPDSKRTWSSIAWLGWASIGMTRGSEYASLAATRCLRALSKTEGQELFVSVMQNSYADQVNIPLSAGEINFYNPAIEGTSHSDRNFNILTDKSKNKLTRDIVLDLDSMPFLNDHKINNTSTLPAAFVINLVAESAKLLRPDLFISELVEGEFRRFIRVYKNKRTHIKVHVELIRETLEETLLKIQITSDFVHKSKVVLQKDVLHNQIIVKMSPVSSQPKALSLPTITEQAYTLPDPYVMGIPGVELKGQFNSMNEIHIEGEQRLCQYQLRAGEDINDQYSHYIPNMVLIDALWRFGSIELNDRNKLSVYVPESFRSMKIYYDISDSSVDLIQRKLYFVGSHPRNLSSDRLCAGPIYAVDELGTIYLEVHDAVCKYMNSVEFKLELVS